MKKLLAGWQQRLTGLFTPATGQNRGHALEALGLAERLPACLAAEKARQALIAQIESTEASALLERVRLVNVEPPRGTDQPHLLVIAQPLLAKLLAKLSQTSHWLVRQVRADDELAEPSEEPFPSSLAVELAFAPEHGQAIIAPFLQRLVAVSSAPARHAREHGAGLLTAWVEVGKEGDFQLEIGQPQDPALSAEEATRNLLAYFEGKIRQAPEQVDWTQPAWEPPAHGLLFSRRYPALATAKAPVDCLAFQVLVRSPDSLRDACIAVPTIRALKNGRPDLRVALLAGPETAELWREIGEADAVFVLGQPTPPSRYDWGLVLEPSRTQVAELRKAGCRRVAGLDHANLAEILDDVLPAPETLGPPEHRQRTYLRVAHRLGAEVRHDASLFAPAKLAAATPTEASGWVIGIAPDAEAGSSHAWPRENFLRVIELLAEFPELSWRVFLASRDADNTAFWENFGYRRRRATVSFQPPGDSVSGQLRCLSQCFALVGNDNSQLHLAALLGLGTVGIFGPSDPVTVAPRHARACTIHHHVECGPCHLAQCPLDHRCMKAVTVEEVTDAVRTLIHFRALG